VNHEQARTQREEPEQNSQSAPGPHKATVRRQNSARRHTLSSGVDYSMVSIGNNWK